MIRDDNNFKIDPFTIEVSSEFKDKLAEVCEAFSLEPILNVKFSNFSSVHNIYFFSIFLSMMKKIQHQ
jgi:hypothetical protein